MEAIKQSISEYKAGDNVKYWIRDAKTPEAIWEGHPRNPDLVQKAGEWRDAVVDRIQMVYPHKGTPYPMVMVKVDRCYCSGVWNTDTFNNDLTFFVKENIEGEVYQENLRLLPN